MISNRPFPHSNEQLHQVEVRADKNTANVRKRPPRPRSGAIKDFKILYGGLLLRPRASFTSACFLEIKSSFLCNYDQYDFIM